ncbi:hypothetical protein [Microbacterium oleivorans]|uniref:Uncharacterized protein n=1 Tax=Microbacterium oleivorans TaxID=273677 RepID=A0A7D5IMR1_9MICO|nr:hypothetical protein [Microbacterium oleivorans]QLD10399.1 hypothetical protein HW566_00500 [Microbacterium oleivorans]
MITLAPPPAPGLIAVGADRWRVVDRDGIVRGLIESGATPAGMRFRALRFHVASRTFRPVGEFWSAAEAADTLRLSR